MKNNNEKRPEFGPTLSSYEESKRLCLLEYERLFYKDFTFGESSIRYSSNGENYLIFTNNIFSIASCDTKEIYSFEEYKKSASEKVGLSLLYKSHGQFLNSYEIIRPPYICINNELKIFFDSELSRDLVLKRIGKKLDPTLSITMSWED